VRRARKDKAEDPDIVKMREAMEGWTVVDVLPGRRPESRCILSLEKDGARKNVHLHGTDMGMWITLDR